MSSQSFGRNKKHLKCCQLIFKLTGTRGYYESTVIVLHCNKICIRRSRYDDNRDKSLGRFWLKNLSCGYLPVLKMPVAIPVMVSTHKACFSPKITKQKSLNNSLFC